MSDATHLAEAHPISKDAHTADVHDDLPRPHEAKPDVKEEAQVHEYTTTTSEPPSESREAPAASAVTLPTPAFPDIGDSLGSVDAAAPTTEQTPDAPYLPPRPADEHPAWTHQPRPDLPSMNRDVAREETGNREEHINPEVAQLKSMFPDFDDAVLYVTRFSQTLPLTRMQPADSPYLSQSTGHRILRSTYC